MIHLFFNFLRRFNNYDPTRWEVRYCVKIIKSYNDYIPLTTRIQRMMEEYAAGYELEEIAQIHSIPRERVRQCLMKGCRVAYGLKG